MGFYLRFSKSSYVSGIGLAISGIVICQWVILWKLQFTIVRQFIQNNRIFTYLLTIERRLLFSLQVWLFCDLMDYGPAVSSVHRKEDTHLILAAPYFVGIHFKKGSKCWVGQDIPLLGIKIRTWLTVGTHTKWLWE